MMEMDNLTEKLASRAILARHLFCRPIHADDIGKGDLSISARAASIFLKNGEERIEIRWPDGHITRNPVISRHGEHYLHGIPFLADEGYTGSLFVMFQTGATVYEAYLLQADEDIDVFHALFNIPMTHTDEFITLSSLDKMACSAITSCSLPNGETASKTLPGSSAW